MADTNTTQQLPQPRRRPPIDRFYSYRLGNDIIDEEHAAIYYALEAMFKNIPPETLEDQILAAKNVCLEHFKHEIAMMEHYAYPHIESHKAVHTYTEKVFSDFFDNPTPEMREIVIVDLLHHIDWYDRPFVIFMQGTPKRRVSDGPDRFHTATS